MQPAPPTLMDIWYLFPSLNRPLWMKHCCAMTCSLVGMCSDLWTFIWDFATRWLQLCKPPATKLSHSGSSLSRSSDCSSFPFMTSPREHEIADKDERVQNVEQHLHYGRILAYLQSLQLAFYWTWGREERRGRKNKNKKKDQPVGTDEVIAVPNLKMTDT